MLEERLHQRGAKVFRTSREALPGASFFWSPGNAARFGGRLVAPASGFWRRPGRTDLSSVKPEYSTFADHECEDAFDGAFLASDIKWLNGPRDVERAEFKILQLTTARELGLSIPPTLVTNSAKTAARFASEYPSVVVKPVRYGLVSSGHDARVAWTSRTSRQELLSLRGPPVLLQMQLHTESHLRVVTVADRSFISQLRTEQLDWRSDLDNHQRFRALSRGTMPEVEAGAVAIADALHVGYSSQDWVVDAESQAWFLDLNPSGQWLFVDAAHRGRITQATC